MKAYQELSAAQRRKIIGGLRKLHQADFETFFHELEVCLTRLVKSVFVLALHGRSCEATTVDDVILFIENYDETHEASEFVRYEVNVRFSTGDEIRAIFQAKTEAIKFLQGVK